MKKLFLVFMFLISFLLISCNNEITQESELNENKIYPRKLTASEKELLSLVGLNDTVEIYDFETDGTYKSISIWLEVYKDGKLLENRGKMFSSFDNKKGSIALKVEKNETYNWQVSVKSEGQIATAAFESTDAFLKDKNYSMASSHLEATTIEKEQPVVLKVFLFDSDVSTAIYGLQQYEENPELLKAYEYVYLLKGEFLENRYRNDQKYIEEEK